MDAYKASTIKLLIMTDLEVLNPSSAQPANTTNADSFAIENPSNTAIDSIGVAKKNSAIA